MNKDYTIIIHTDTPMVFDSLDEVLTGQWDARMVNLSTGDEWRKEGSTPETSTTAPASFEPVEPLPEMGEWSQG